MKRVDVGQNMWSVVNESEMAITESGSGWGGTWYGHGVPDLSDFFTLGTVAMREKIERYFAKNPEKKDFY